MISLPPDVSQFIFSQTSWDYIKEVAEPEVQKESLTGMTELTGIEVVVNEDPNERQMIAWKRCLIYGLPTAYEDDDGNLVTIATPPGNPVFPTFQWRGIEFHQPETDNESLHRRGLGSNRIRPRENHG